MKNIYFIFIFLPVQPDPVPINSIPEQTIFEPSGRDTEFPSEPLDLLLYVSGENLQITNIGSPGNRYFVKGTS